MHSIDWYTAQVNPLFYVDIKSLLSKNIDLWALHSYLAIVHCIDLFSLLPVFEYSAVK